ncbi:MAG: cation transporter [Fibromonadaceae bacterium]|jgi:copper chaperone|nr:cation transporter [Fibromonadaceae bacterium]
MEKTILKVEGMSSDHCVVSVVTSVEALPGVAKASVNLAAKIVAVEYDPSQIALNKIKEKIEEQGYDVL